MIINHNMKSINAHRMMGVNASGMGKSIEKLSSGLRINRAADDAAGLAISEKMRSQIRGMQQASRNAQDGISVVQTAEGALDEVHSMLQRMKQLAVQSANDSNQSLVDREALQLEVDQLTDEINSITDKTQFNKMRLLDGSFNDKQFHVGANQNETIGVSIKSMTAEGLGLKIGGKEDIFDPSGKSREIIAKASAQGAQAAGKLGTAAAELDISTDGDFHKDTADASVSAGKAHFRIEYNGKFKDVYVDTEGGNGVHALKKDAVGNALVNAFNELSGGTNFKWNQDKIQADTNKEVPPVSGKVPASIGVEFVNAYEIMNKNVDAVKKVGSAYVQGTPKGAVAEISHTLGTRTSLEIRYGSSDIRTVVIGAKDNDAAIKAKIEEALGTDKVTVASTGGKIKITDKVDSFDSALSIKAAGESDLKSVAYRGVNILNREAANDSISNVQKAIETLASRRAELGAIQNRIEHTIKNLDNSAENLQAAESRVRDVDMADEMSKFTRANILTQASQAMLAQANQLPQQVLQLLR